MLRCCMPMMRFCRQTHVECMHKEDKTHGKYTDKNTKKTGLRIKTQEVTGLRLID